MGYKVLNTVDNMRDNYGPRKGLEGPYNFNGRVLYYDCLLYTSDAADE